MLGENWSMGTETSEEPITSSMSDNEVDEDTSCKFCDKCKQFRRLSMTSPGVFRCSESDIQFQVTLPVTIDYEVDSWSNYTEILQNLRGGYEIIGPLFNIKSRLEPNMVSAVYLPHCLCLGGFKGDKSLIQCFHYKDDNLVLETPSRLEGKYAVLENPTFSCIGVILYPLNLLQDTIIKLIPYHGMVLLFSNTIIREDLRHKYRLHLYLLPRIRTVEKEVERTEMKFSFQRIPKPPQTESVYYKKKYRIDVPLTASVNPKTLLFESHCPSEIYAFTEISIVGETSTEVNVSLLPEDEDVTVWKSVVTAGDCSSFPQSAHFVDKHRAKLIRMISVVDSVLDDLLDENLLTYEQYQTVISKSTSAGQMRILYDYIRAWGDDDKDKVYQSLRTHNHRTIKKLEKEVPGDVNEHRTLTGRFRCHIL
ncbi:NACHT, LRR and PYD domains-containing protein 1a-like [Leptodactylus fuscus]